MRVGTGSASAPPRSYVSPGTYSRASALTVPPFASNVTAIVSGAGVHVKSERYRAALRPHDHHSTPLSSYTGIEYSFHTPNS